LNRAVGLVLLFLVAYAYQRLGIFLSINFMDEGTIVYPSWRVAEGETPYADFRHLYPPSVFYLNAWLFKTFGVDLSVLRFFLAGVKAATCVLVYVCARRMARQAFSLLAFAMCAVWMGLIWPNASTPYPSHHATLLCLSGLLFFLSFERRYFLACAGAGLCFGLAATFKQTFGAFAFLALALFLIANRRSWPSNPSRVFAFLSKASRWFVLGFSAVVSIVYLIPNNPFWNFLLIASPVIVLLTFLVVREAKHQPDLTSAMYSFSGTVFLSLGFVTPIAAYALLYVSMGHGEEILFNTLTGIPTVTNWASPFPVPSLRFVLLFIAFAGLFTSLVVWRGRPKWTIPKLELGLTVAAAGFSSAAFVALALRGWPVEASDWWFWGTSDLLFCAPFVIVWLGLATWFWNDERWDDVESPVGQSPQLLFTCFTTMGILWLFPSADIWHVIAFLPSCLPLVAGLFERFWSLQEGNESPNIVFRFAAASAIVVLSLTTLLPAVRDLIREREEKPAFEIDLLRATHVRGNSGQYSSYKNGGRVIRYLREDVRKDEPIFIMSAKPLLYFLAERKSLVQEYEFVLYMTSFNLVEIESARELVDENLLVEKLRAARPLIVDDYHDEGASHIRKMFPKLAELVSTHYQVKKKFGNFHVLQWTSDP